MSTINSPEEIQIILKIEKCVENGKDVRYATSDSLPGFLVEAKNLEEMRKIVSPIAEEHVNLTYNPHYRSIILKKMKDKEKQKEQLENAKTMHGLFLRSMINDTQSHV